MLLRIRARKDQFYRSGIRFTYKFQEIDTDSLGLTDTQVKSLLLEPSLVVVQVENTKPGEPEKPSSGDSQEPGNPNPDVSQEPGNPSPDVSQKPATEKPKKGKSKNQP